MSASETVLLLGATGRTGGRVLARLLDLGCSVRAIVRSPEKISPDRAAHPNLTLVRGEVLTMSEEEWREQTRGCGAVISCLGHVLSFRGVFGPPFDLVLRATTRVGAAVAQPKPARPVRFVLMSSVSVHRPSPLDARRSAGERAFLWVLRGLMPPARDNQRAADYLRTEIGANHPALEWAAVRPDSLLEGERTEYAVHEGLVDSLFRPGHSRMENVAHFMADLATREEVWRAWRGKFPVIVDR